MRIKLFNYEIHLFNRDRQAPRTRELADSQAAALVRALHESSTLMDDVFAQPDLEVAEPQPTTDISPNPCPDAQTAPPPKASPQE